MNVLPLPRQSTSSRAPCVIGLALMFFLTGCQSSSQEGPVNGTETTESTVRFSSDETTEVALQADGKDGSEPTNAASVVAPVSEDENYFSAPVKAQSSVGDESVSVSVRLIGFVNINSPDGTEKAAILANGNQTLILRAGASQDGIKLVSIDTKQVSVDVNGTVLDLELTSQGNAGSASHATSPIARPSGIRRTSSRASSRTATQQLALPPPRIPTVPTVRTRQSLAVPAVNQVDQIDIPGFDAVMQQRK